MRSDYEKMHTGELYLPTDAELMRLQGECLEKLYDYNCTYLTVYNDETGSIFDDIYECVYKDDLLSVYDITSLKGDLQ